ncbi:MAG TPA: hypothetical protein VHE23_03215 [Candidatus Acidoferrales bacterium]|nr:hypothetical protein [Candidatus Acidoferrales bacterium]
MRLRNARLNHTGKKRRRGMRTQGQILCDVMLAAAACEAWLTLEELALLTRFGEASISAQLRHLRKPSSGGFVIEKRLRDAAESQRRPAQCGALWEYRLLSPACRMNGGRPRRRRSVARHRRAA